MVAEEKAGPGMLVRAGMEGDLYNALWKRPAVEGSKPIEGHRRVAITPDELQTLAADPRWGNVNRRRDHIRRQLGPASGFYGTLGDMAIFVEG